MIVFTESKHIPTSADIFQLSVDENGYVLVSKDVYDALLDIRARGTLEEMYSAFQINPTYAMDFFVSAVPTPLNYLAILFDRLTFEPETDLAELFGICSVILEPQTFTSIIEQGLEQFKLREYSRYILKEYQIPRRVFLTSCIPYEQLLNPGTVPNKINVLVLGNGGTLTASPTVMSSVNSNGFGVTASASTSSYSESNDPDNQQYYISRKSDYAYFGEGTFLLKSTGEMVAIDVYDETVINKAFGIEPEPDISLDTNIEVEEVTGKANAATSNALVSDVDSGNDERRKHATEIFAKTRDQRNL